MAAPHRFFVDRDAVLGDLATLVADQARQIASVLRLPVGTEVILVLDGRDLLVRLASVNSRQVSGTVIARSLNSAEPTLSLTLALPLLRGDHSEEVLEAVTQLGVSRIVPFVSERSVVRELSTSKRERWERIARESAETARRGRVPTIDPLSPWSDLLALLPKPVIVAWENEGTGMISDVTVKDEASLVIGPEGGFTEGEIDLARDGGAAVVSLGPRNLRSETACIAGVAIVISASEARRG